MAIDEALLDAMPRLGRAVLRFYSWSEPAASFGYFQKFSEVERRVALRPLVRRPTGGGIVPHDHDWTYSASFPVSSHWYDLKATESYCHIHQCIRDAFGKLGISTELAASARIAAPGECFAGYEKSDVLWHGRKIAGAAQRRNRCGLLIQGSVQPPPIPLSREAWESALIDGFNARLGCVGKPFDLDELLEARVKQLVEQKYGCDSFNRKR